jgi:glycosyltransferase involved in cell wall biosynthesis
MVVDDGSTDRGSDVLEGVDIHLVRHPHNRGKGAALLTAAGEAKRMGKTHMVTLDADGQHDPMEFPLFTASIKADPLAIIVGKRNLDVLHVPGGRRFGRWFSNFWFRVQTGRSIGDAQSGFRAYPLAVLDWLKLKESRFTLEIEVLVKAAWAGVPIRDLDISVSYLPPDEHISHFRLFMDNLRLSILNARLTIRSMVPWPHRKFPLAVQGGDAVSLLHPIRSIGTLLTGDNTPDRLAAAGGLGILLGTFPLIAFHTLAILFAAGYLRLNKIVAVTTSQLCMPPLVPALCIETGHYLRHGAFLTEISLETLGYQAADRILEWIIGSLFLGPALAVLVGSLIYLMAQIVKWNQHSRS